MIRHRNVIQLWVSYLYKTICTGCFVLFVPSPIAQYSTGLTRQRHFRYLFLTVETRFFFQYKHLLVSITLSRGFCTFSLDVDGRAVHVARTKTSGATRPSVRDNTFLENTVGYSFTHWRGSKLKTKTRFESVLINFAIRSPRYGKTLPKLPVYVVSRDKIRRNSPWRGMRGGDFFK